jgi:hypothetical protein
VRRSSRSSNPLPSDIALTLPELGIDIEKITRGEAWALCPNPKHFDHEASWSINIDTGQHYCFSCGWGGNFLILVKARQRYSEDEDAEVWIRQHGGIDVAIKKLRGDRAYEKQQAEEVHEADLAFFEDPPKWALKERDIDLYSAREFGVRWDPARDCWIFPVRDPETGVLRGWQSKGRKMLNFPEHLEKADTLFGYHLLGDTAYLEESPIDPVRLHTYNIDGAVSGYGVHVCLDNDAAGRRKERDLWTRYRSQIRMLFANYDHVQDDNYKKDHGEMTPDEIDWSLTNAIPALRFRP